MPEPREMRIEELKHLGAILLGAANADGVRQNNETEAIRKILVEEQGGRELPEALERYLEAFDIDRFDLEASCAALAMTSPERRRWLLQLVARVTECDDIHDFDESDYIMRVAKCIGASEQEYAGLTVDVHYEDLPHPPPVPDDD